MLLIARAAAEDESNKSSDPPAGPLDAAAYLARAPGQALEPAFFLVTVVSNIPNFLRPVRAVWTILTLPVIPFHPVGGTVGVAEIPGDLGAPFKGTFEIIKDTPKLAGPVKALWSVLRAGVIALRPSPVAPARPSQGPEPSTNPV